MMCRSVLSFFLNSSAELTHNTDEAEAAAMFTLASNKHCPDTLAPISTFDLRDTLEVSCNLCEAVLISPNLYCQLLLYLVDVEDV